jgi:hypothetical protein
MFVVCVAARGGVSSQLPAFREFDPVPRGDLFDLRSRQFFTSDAQHVATFPYSDTMTALSLIISASSRSFCSNTRRASLRRVIAEFHMLIGLGWVSLSPHWRTWPPDARKAAIAASMGAWRS